MIDHREHSGHRAHNLSEVALKSVALTQSHISFNNFFPSTFSAPSVVNLHSLI